jgi:hypothetical protein
VNRPEPACLVIADIAGHTGYLAGVELDHAQDILADLVDTVIAGLRPGLRLAKLKGDAEGMIRQAGEELRAVLQDLAAQRRLEAEAAPAEPAPPASAARFATEPVGPSERRVDSGLSSSSFR